MYNYHNNHNDINNDIYWSAKIGSFVEGISNV